MIQVIIQGKNPDHETFRRVYYEHVTMMANDMRGCADWNLVQKTFGVSGIMLMLLDLAKDPGVFFNIPLSSLIDFSVEGLKAGVFQIPANGREYDLKIGDLKFTIQVNKLAEPGA